MPVADLFFVSAYHHRNHRMPEPLHIRPKYRRIIHDSYAMDAIRRDLERILEEHNIKLGGLSDQVLREAARRPF